MRTRRGSLLNGTTYGDAILMYQPGDVVKPVTVMDQFFTGVVRSVDTKTNKITVAWGGGPVSQHDADEIMPMPFFGAAHKNGTSPKSASTRRMRADVNDILAVPPEVGEEVIESDTASNEQTDFVEDDMEDLLNRQVGNEFYSAYLYYMVAAILQSKGLVGFQNWMEKQGDGEIEHAMKVYKYLVDTGSTVELPAIPSPAISAGMEVADLTRFVLDHEMGVTQDWKRIGQLSKQQDNPATCQLVQWFMTEQVEEEDAALTLHQRVQMADSGSGLLMIDNDLKDRSPIAVTASDETYTQALDDAKQMMDNDEELEPTSALKQAGKDNGIQNGSEMSKFVAWANKKLGFKASDVNATNPPMDQFCGEPDTHGLDEPRGGGFSIMKDLAYQLHDEANNFADVDPRIASIQAGLKEIAFDANTMTCADCEASQFIRKATSGDEPSAQRTIEEENTKSARKSSVSSTAADCGALALDGLRSRRAMYWCAPDRTFRLTQQEQSNGTAMCPQCKCDMNKERFTRSEKLLICPSCGFKVPTSKAVTQIEVKVPENVDVQVTKTDGAGVEVCGENITAGTRRGRFAYADPADLADLPRMLLRQIADIVYKDWKNVNYAAKPYLEAMATLNNVSDNYIADSGSSIVAYFLSNATSWRGEVAKAVKKELNRRIR